MRKYSKSSSVWEDLVDDFLEMTALLQPHQRIFLIQKLRRRGVSADKINPHAGFSIDGRLVVICKREREQECWLYDPEQRHIEMQKI